MAPILNPYSTRFLGGTLNVGQVADYMVPAGYRAVVRSITLTTGGTGGASPAVTVKSLTFIYQSPVLAAASCSVWEGNHVVNPGETIEVTTSGAGIWYMVSGFLLTVT